MAEHNFSNVSLRLERLSLLRWEISFFVSYNDSTFFLDSTIKVLLYLLTRLLSRVYTFRTCGYSLRRIFFPPTFVWYPVISLLMGGSFFV